MENFGEELEPQKKPPQSANSRTLLVIILIGFVMAIVFGMKAQFPRGGSGGYGSSGAGSLLVALGWWPVAILGPLCLFLGWLCWNLIRNGLHYSTENNTALALYKAGRLAEAEAIYVKQLQLKNTKYELLTKNNLACVVLQQGRFDYAARLLRECSEIKQIPKLPIPSIAMARLHACYSELEIAEKAFDAAIELMSEAERGELAVSNALISVRRGAYKLVGEMPDEDWFEAETNTGHGMRCLRILRAFALAKLPPSDANQARMQEMLAGARPFRPNEFNYLTPRLPELAEFLKEHGFATVDQTAATASALKP